MPRVPPQQEPVPHLSADAANANTVKIMREERDILEAMIEALMADPPAPAVKLKPKDRYEWFRAHIKQAHAGDIFGEVVEIALLLQDDYVTALKAGMAPPVISHPFRNYLPTPMTPGGMLLGLEAWRKWFAKLHKEYGEEVVPSGAATKPVPTDQRAVARGTPSAPDETSVGY